MPMAPYQYLDLGARITALRTVGFALGAGNAMVPDNKASYDVANAAYWINKLRVQQGLGAVQNLDHNGFVSALNVLAALVP